MKIFIIFLLLWTYVTCFPHPDDDAEAPDEEDKPKDEKPPDNDENPKDPPPEDGTPPKDNDPGAGSSEPGKGKSDEEDKPKDEKPPDNDEPPKDPPPEDDTPPDNEEPPQESPPDNESPPAGEETPQEPPPVEDPPKSGESEYYVNSDDNQVDTGDGDGDGKVTLNPDGVPAGNLIDEVKCLCVTRGPLSLFKLRGNLHFKNVKLRKFESRLTTTESTSTLCTPCDCSNCFTHDDTAASTRRVTICR